MPARRTALTARDAADGGAYVDLEVRGPKRIALLDANGSGKTTLVEDRRRSAASGGGAVEPAVPLRYLAQRLDVLDDAAMVAVNVARAKP